MFPAPDRRVPAHGPRRDRASGVALILVSVMSLQFGAALAATVFPLVGPVAVVSLRLLTSALVLLVLARGLRWPGRTATELVVPIGMGVVLAVMNTCVYEALARLPLGVVITLEFLGPLAVALWHSRRRLDVTLALAALGGVALLTGGLAGADDVVGVAFILVGAAGWACYIALSREMGRRGADGGMAVSSVVAAVLVVPVAVAQAGHALLRPRVLVVGLVVGVLSSAVPYTLDRLALRRIEPGTFGVLMSVHPAVAALAGLLMLDQTLAPAQVVGMAVVVAVSALAVRAPGAVAPSDRYHRRVPEFRIKHAAQLLGVSDDTVRRWIDSGRLTSSADASGRRIVEGDVLAAFARELAQAAPRSRAERVVAESARNRFTGLVTRVVRDTVMAQVEIQAGPFRVVSLMSREAADELGLEPGVLAVASVKSTNVVVEIPESL